MRTSRIERLLDIVHGRGRAAEWITSAVLAVIGITLLMPGETMGVSSSYAGFRSLGVSDGVLGVAVLVVGAVRLTALYINGSWRRTPLLRAVGAVCGLVIFTMLLSAFLFPFFYGHAPALNTGTTYLILAIADLFSCYRTGADVGRNQ
ncbi:hypothetical protein [Profundibacterium mesophilum]|uniref:Uncharacterized protein n=1 Tax=Profundibacterium mesophilum KAUST100406-0324 TaxID=1037889 RepID=A0A921TCF2_9RHOB|nr:hypothetical protein [Profundibacterium mesophilum]KAF0675061.1 hypothetical protein PMES_02582 [Profundibacterium mesophilum KAUST100406-0324]